MQIGSISPGGRRISTVYGISYSINMDTGECIIVYGGGWPGTAKHLCSTKIPKRMLFIRGCEQYIYIGIHIATLLLLAFKRASEAGSLPFYIAPILVSVLEGNSPRRETYSTILLITNSCKIYRSPTGHSEGKFLQ